MNEKQLLKELTLLDGAPAYEKNVREFMKEQMEDIADEIIYDKLGSIFAVKKSKKKNAPKVMLAGHMDEVGFMITGYTKSGLLHFKTLGGWWNQTMLAHRLTIHTEDKQYVGVISSIAPHLLTPEMRAKPMDINNMLIDCGFKDEEDAKKHIPIGSMAAPRVEFVELPNDRLLSKAFDNRYGCAMAIDILNHFKDIDLDCDLYLGATVQEEAGLKGAVTAANLVKPDYAIVVDSSPAKDTSPSDEKGHLGEGFLLRIKDPGSTMSPKIRNFVIDCANKTDSKFQYYTSTGGTDARAIEVSSNGVLVSVIGMASRGIHSHSSIMDLNDYKYAKSTIIEMIKQLNEDKIKELHNA